MSLKPLIVLVHGALTDASVWNSVAVGVGRQHTYCSNTPMSISEGD
jgi:hypothetical protein